MAIIPCGPSLRYLAGERGPKRHFHLNDDPFILQAKLPHLSKAISIQYCSTINDNTAIDSASGIHLRPEEMKTECLSAILQESFNQTR